MATYYARKAGNINATDVWATTPGGTASNLFPTFTNADVLISNSFAIAVNVSTTVAEVRNDATGGATASGSFTLSDGVTLTASIYSGTNFTCVLFTAANPAVAHIVANEIRSNGIGSNQASGAHNSSTGTLNITVTNIFSGTASSGGVPTCGVLHSGAGNTIITCSGLITGGAGSQSPGVANTNITGGLTITGNVQGGISASGALNITTGTINIIGSAIGSAASALPGASNSSTGTIRLTRAVGNAFGPGNTSGLAAAVGVANAGLGIIEIEQLEYGTFGMSPTSGTGIRLKKLGSNVAAFNYCDTAGAKTLIDATTNAAMPAASNVRSGVSYASGALTGSCAVPAAGSVALGVPVDNTTGTAVLTPAAVWGHASRTLTTSSGPTAVEIRQEMDSNSTKLANLDAAISSRLAGSAYSAAPTTAQIATAVEGSLLNEADGQAVLNAIVGAIGNTNLSEVSLVAAVRADLERVGGKLDSIPTTAAPTAAQNATAVWGAATRSVTGGTVDTLTNAPASVTPTDIWSHATRTLTSASGPTAVQIRQEMDSNSTQLSAIKAKTDNLPADPADQSLLEAAIAGVTAPSAATVASAVRSELLVELARVDQAVSTRLAGSAYTAPANSDVAAIKVKTDALVVERLNNCATTAIVGNLLAQANS